MESDTKEKSGVKSDGLLETESEVSHTNNDCTSKSAKTNLVLTKLHSCDITDSCKEAVDKSRNIDDTTDTELSAVIVENKSKKDMDMQANPKCTMKQNQAKKICLLTDDTPTNTVSNNIDIPALDITNRNIGTSSTEDDISSISVCASNLNNLCSLEKVHDSEQVDSDDKMDMPLHEQVNSAKMQMHISTEDIIISNEINTSRLTIDPNNTVNTATKSEMIVDGNKVVNDAKTTKTTFAINPENIEKRSQSALNIEVTDSDEGLRENDNEVVVGNQMSKACTTENCLEAIDTIANVSEGIPINLNDEINSLKQLTLTSECSVNEQSVVDKGYIKIPECSENSQVSMDCNNITCSDKNMISDIVEPENTEFVQFSQDKHEDPQIENQSADAEDPFGGDNLSSEIVDAGMEADGDVGFSKLCRHVDNLRAVINNENSDINKKHNSNDNIPGSPKPCQNNDSIGNKTDAFPRCDIIDNTEKLTEETEKRLTDEADETDKLLRDEADEADETDKVLTDEADETDKAFTDEADETDKVLTDEADETDKLLIDEADETDKLLIDETEEVNKLLTDEAEVTDKLLTNEAESRTKDSEQITKDADTISAMETDQGQSDTLPGQDDELCIVPDSMKVIIPEKDNEKSETDMKSKSPGKKAMNCDSNQENEDKKKTESYDLVQIDTENEKSDGITNDERRENSSTNISPKKLDDVINIDEESKNSEIEEIATKEICKQCKEEKSCTIKVKIGSESYNVCSKTCKALFKIANNKATDIPSDGVNSKHEKRCADCLLVIEPNDEKNLSWETMEFCNETCLGKFQTKYGSYCRNCNGSVQAVSLGKYCVRFGYDVRQFCCSSCLEEFKKGLKVCSYCQKDISSGAEGFLAPVGDKGQFKDFCTQNCMEKYSKMSSTEPSVGEKKSCSVCQEEKFVHCEVQLDRTTSVAICSEPCLAAFKFVNKVDPDQCSTCKKFFERPNKKGFVVFYENEAHTFCTKTCLNVFIITNRKIVPCNWCKVKKYNFDMIKKELKTGQIMTMCSLNCLTLYQVSINAVSAKRINCDFCKEFSQAQYHLTMSDATIRNFCSYNCVMNFQAQYTKSPITIPSGDDPVPTGMPKRTLPSRTITPNPPKANEIQNKKNMPVISSVTSLAELANGQSSPQSQQTNINSIVVSSNAVVQNQNAQVIYKQQIITRPSSPVKIHNKMTQCKPLTHTKGVSVRPHPCTKSTQTEEVQKVLVPIPVPIYVPFPMHMYSMPFPVPVPFPLPIPVPIFIPTTRNSAKGIFKDIKRIQEKIPADPFEAELLMMAEMVATEKKANESDSDSGDDRDDGEESHDNSRSFSPDGVESGNTFGEDMLQMALKMATGELDEPAVDLEAALTPNTITATQTPAQPETSLGNDVQSERLIAGVRGRKRMVSYKGRSTPSKRGRRVSNTHDVPLMPPPEPQPPPPRMIEPVEKPDANMALKYTFGVNAWRQWVTTKNAELEKQNTPARRMKLFKTDLLQLTADELNYSLCLFVKEVRKPNGSEYAPDTIYYLCLGIQQYLFENSRIDNIFTDSYYEKFTDCLNEVAKKFSVLYNDAQYIVTRVEEEHLWECKQLGAHSPHVLLSTLMFFNTKHFNLVSVEEHMQLSFSHIMKHWKRNPAAQPTTTGKVPGSRNVLLRFYPPQSALEANSRKKKVYEQQENEENPLRCPVKLYEFYLSKCPESVKTRNDVFYLLPERSCVPDSPVWYSTSPLAKEHLVKMLYRIKMVKEINVALLSS